MKSVAYFFFLFVLCGCVTRYKNICYGDEGLLLDVFVPRKIKDTARVQVFFHGGNWRAGNKNLYKFYGKGMARKGIVTVIPNYRLSRKVTYKEMAMDAATAIKWTRLNIAKYHGDPDQIFLSGHSSGGHLAALMGTDQKYLDSMKTYIPLKGIILIDPFGLDMKKYLSASTRLKRKVYYPAFTSDSTAWADGSPIFHLHEGISPFLILSGGRTFPWISEGTLDFYYALKEFPARSTLAIQKRKGHFGMITQFYFGWSRGYDVILDWIYREEREL
jgi:acetyl esterase/lipase